MSTALAFLSAKGGSGKTTLALSIADLLCKCKVRTLLVDCDFSTNGATYFYESNLADHNAVSVSSIHSLYEILFDSSNKTRIFSDNTDIAPLVLNDYLAFLPSIPEISKQYCAGEPANSDGAAREKDRLEAFFWWAKNSYDIILFDCQAGYTPLLSALLPLVDIDLIVLETDSISASAMRSLHLKIGDLLHRAAVYQVFNKAMPEEVEVYSRIVGTFFTNIGTLQFDWKIRQAFSRSQIPDIVNSSADFGLTLCEICGIMFRSAQIQRSLASFKVSQRLRQLEEERISVIEQMNQKQLKITDYQEKSKEYARTLKRKRFRMILAIAWCVLSSITLVLSHYEISGISWEEAMLLATPSTIILLLSASETLPFLSTLPDETIEIAIEGAKVQFEEELKKIDEERHKLEEQLSKNSDS